jgi:hypothetical protein
LPSWLQDKFSPQLKQMQRNLRSLAATTSESSRAAGEVNSIGATGIAQWLGPRKACVKRGDFEGQLKHAIDELNGSEKRAGDVLRNAKTAQEAATGASMKRSIVTRSRAIDRRNASRCQRKADQLLDHRSGCRSCW